MGAQRTDGHLQAIEVSRDRLIYALRRRADRILLNQPAHGYRKILAFISTFLACSHINA